MGKPLSMDLLSGGAGSGPGRFTSSAAPASQRSRTIVPVSVIVANPVVEKAATVSVEALATNDFRTS